MSDRREYIAGIVFILLSALAWSFTGYFTRLIALDSVTVIARRGIFGSLSLVGVSILAR
ncbi:hypothetical protein JJB09_25420 [Rhizobium sp. KVB221]|uniref:Uncharacterized protein n=1 Tax=Rhizobium setariae TaxID=2801340 RepID=A0A936YX07_9HYPH|nr:hypothetical protein [Rhizobium setariae]MBL0375360.1 hypothetical protein [Rhizobium setariae]